MSIVRCQMVIVDLYLVRFLNTLAASSRFTRIASVFLAGILIWVEVAIVIGIVIVHNEWQVGLRGIVAFAIAYGINRLFKMTLFHPRPFVEWPLHQLVQKSPLASSFPSDHAAGAAVLYSIGSILAPSLTSYFLLLTLLVPLGRVLAGVHYLTDVVSGWCIGWIVSIMLFAVFV